MLLQTRHIEITPGTCGSKPRIKGTRIKVQNIVNWYYFMGLSPEVIAQQYPQLTLANIYAALAFYHDNKDAIDADIKDSEEFVVEMRSSANSKLREKISIMKLAETGFPELF